jgi:acetyl-CoA synthetase
MSQNRVFPPSPAFAAQAHIKTEALRQAFVDTAAAQPEGFWRELSRAIRFDKPYEKVLEWNCPSAKWFVNGLLNLSVNCLDRHLKERGDKTALLWEGEPLPGGRPETRDLSYSELHAMTCRIANTLREQGVGLGDRVAIYMPMAPETVASMLACARIGAVHTVIFGGFSAQSVYDRAHDAQAKVVITADGTWRKGAFLKLKPIVDEALAKGPHDVKKVLVFRRDPSQECAMQAGRDLEWSASVEKASSVCEAASLDSEHPLFILYTSGTTGKPKGLYHTQAGYLLWAHWTSRWLFDLKDEDLYWCTADCGWITGHTYVTYGPLSNGASVFLYEGAPLHPTPERFWQMVERHKISILYTAPTAIRTFMRFGEEPLKKHDLKSLRLLGSVGEPINPEAWLWYRENAGGGQCPVVDTWWQTETGGAMIAPFPGTTPLKPGSATKPLPGVDADVVDPETGAALKAGEKGALVIRKPWPSMARGIWGDPARFEKTYWKTKPGFEGIYATSDFAVKDKDGDIWVEGRMDDVLNVSGHRIGTAEVESALVSYPAINEAAAVGIPDPVKGQGIAVFITLKEKTQAEIREGKISVEALKREARDHVGKEIGALAKPDQVRVAKALPKTRSGKIMRRLLKELATTGKITGDTTTLEDFSAQAALDGDE